MKAFNGIRKLTLMTLLRESLSRNQESAKLTKAALVYSLCLFCIGLKLESSTTPVGND